MSDTPLRKAPHPTAKAFFDELDQASSIGKAKEKTDFIRKQTQRLGWRNRHSQSEEYPMTILERSFTVKQIQRGEVEGDFGTGATVWPASVVLLKYLEQHFPRLLLKEKRVIDLGAGTGITSLAAALLGASKVVCTDGSQPVVDLAKENIKNASLQLNNGDLILESTISVCYYWWASGTLQEKFDVVLVSDCVLPKLYPIGPLVDALDELLKDNGVAILSYEHRHYAAYHPKTKFCELADAKGMKVTTIPQSELDPIFSLEDVEIWQVRRCNESTRTINLIREPAVKDNN